MSKHIKRHSYKAREEVIRRTSGLGSAMMGCYLRGSSQGPVRVKRIAEPSQRGGRVALWSVLERGNRKCKGPEVSPHSNPTCLASQGLSVLLQVRQ